MPRRQEPIRTRAVRPLGAHPTLRCLWLPQSQLHGYWVLSQSSIVVSPKLGFIKHLTRKCRALPGSPLLPTAAPNQDLMSQLAPERGQPAGIQPYRPSHWLVAQSMQRDGCEPALMPEEQQTAATPKPLLLGTEGTHSEKAGW